MADNSRRQKFQPLALLLAAAIAVPGILIPLVPPEYRPWGFATFGAIAIFTAARGGRFSLASAMILALGSKLAFDLLNYVQHSYDRDWLPLIQVYVCFAIYALLGWSLLRNNSRPLRVASVTLTGSVQFFLITNFFDWINQSLPYQKNLFGLMESYWMALPFNKGLFVSDFLFTGLLFTLHTLLVRVMAPSGRLATVSVENEPRS